MGINNFEDGTSSDERKKLRIYKGMPGIDFSKIVAQMLQYVDLGGKIASVEKSVEYIVQIPVQYQKQFEAGELFINKNKKTGVEWPTLMKKLENGRKQIVSPLPIKQESRVQGNPMNDFCGNYHNIYLQNQVAQLAEAVKEVCEVVKRIEQGQHDDRVALIDAGREEIMLAMSMKKKEESIRQIEHGRSLLITGKNQIGRELERRISGFQPIPRNPVVRFGKACIKSNYLCKKDDEFEEIEDCYKLYVQATNLLAMSWGITGDTDTLKNTFDYSEAFLRSLNMGAIKTIEYSHPNLNWNRLFYNTAIPDLARDKQFYLERVENYDAITIEISGNELLEVIDNG